MTSPWMTMRDVAIYLRFVHADDDTPNLRQALEWVDRNGIKSRKRGRAVLVHRDDLDAALVVRRA